MAADPENPRRWIVLGASSSIGRAFARLAAADGADATRAIDENNNGFIDKIYVGDLGGQMWRIGQFDQDPVGICVQDS